MSVTITGKLNKAAHQFQAGDSTGFGIRIGVQYYDRETKQKEWTNYEAAVFAKNPGQIQFYQNALIPGAIVEISGSEQKVRTFEGNQGTVLSIEIQGARLGFVGQSAQTPQHPQQQAPRMQQQTPQQQGGFQQPAQPLQQPAPDDFGDIPF